MKSYKIPLIDLILAGLVIGLVSLTYFLTYRAAIESLENEATISAQLRADVLMSELDKQRAVPVILATDPDIINAIIDKKPSNDNLSKKLANLALETKSAVIYVLDINGIAIASSNWRNRDSFVGQDYSFRSYFKEAVKNIAAEQIAQGTISHKPGLYLTHSVVSDGKVVGVVVAKVEFQTIEQKWQGGEDINFVTNPDGQILLTNRPHLRFKPRPDVDSNSIMVHIPSPLNKWHSYLIKSRIPARNVAFTNAIIAAFVCGLIIMLVRWFGRKNRINRQKAEQERTYRHALEESVESRTIELKGINQILSSEINERKAAEKRLANLQIDLVQANKLAALGQITAGVAHEINQPVATIKLLSNNAATLLSKPHKSSIESVQDVLAKINEMSDRIGKITLDLRMFSKKAHGEMAPIKLRSLLETSLLLTQSRIRDFNVEVFQDEISNDLLVLGNRVRLEQVIVNLLQNACEALEGQKVRQIKISTEVSPSIVRLSIRDNGPGVDESIANQLFIPFVTSKTSGLGLGLVIAKDILHEHNGSLTLVNSSDGACFVVELKRVSAP